IRNTIRKVMIVVPVLITSCQVSLKPNIGPDTAHPSTTSTAMMKVAGRPVARAAPFAKRVNHARLAAIVAILQGSGSAAARRRGAPMLHGCMHAAVAAGLARLG